MSETAWYETIGEFRISRPAYRLLALLFKNGGAWLVCDTGEREALDAGWVSRTENGYCTLTSEGYAVCRQLGMGGAS